MMMLPQVSPPPEKSKLSVNEAMTSENPPVANVLIPEMRQLSRIHFDGSQFTSLLPPGISTM